jgi:hypothetical protein
MRLAEMDLPIGLIAFEVGLSNLANFNRRFRRVRGISPSRIPQIVLARRRPAPGFRPTRSGHSSLFTRSPQEVPKEAQLILGAVPGKCESDACTRISLCLQCPASRQVRGGPGTLRFSIPFPPPAARAMGYESFICLSLASRAVFQMAEALRIRSSFSCPSPCKSSSVRRPSRSSWANTSGRIE